MTIIGPIVYIILGLGALIAQMVYFLIDDREVNHTPKDLRIKKYWHAAGGAIHIWMGCMVGSKYGWHYGFLMGALTWYFFDGFINSYVLNKEWWYIGTTAWLDVTQRKIADFLHLDARLFSALVKHVVLGASIFFIIKGFIK